MNQQYKYWEQHALEDGVWSAEWICQSENGQIRWTLHDGEVDGVQITTI